MNRCDWASVVASMGEFEAINKLTDRADSVIILLKTCGAVVALWNGCSRSTMCIQWR